VLNLAAVLAENPRLTTLALSLQYSAIQQGYRIDNLEDPELEHNKLCWRMCSTFSNELKQPPLSLRRLHLGKVLKLTWTESGAPHQTRAARAGYQFVGEFEDFISICVEDPELMVFSHENSPRP
jgi:hypothetical protein